MRGSWSFANLAHNMKLLAMSKTMFVVRELLELGSSAEQRLERLPR